MKPPPLRPPLIRMPGPEPKPDTVLVNSSGTAMRVPGKGEQPIVGVEKKALDAKALEHAKLNARLQRQMRSDWRCLQCKSIWRGTIIRVKVENVGGVKTEVLICPDTKCDGPVILWRDALSLTNPPGGDKGAV